MPHLHGFHLQEGILFFTGLLPGSQKKLPPDSSAVEFLQYSHHGKLNRIPPCLLQTQEAPGTVILHRRKESLPFTVRNICLPGFRYTEPIRQCFQYFTGNLPLPPAFPNLRYLYSLLPLPFSALSCPFPFASINFISLLNLSPPAHAYYTYYTKFHDYCKYFRHIAGLKEINVNFIVIKSVFLYN